MLCIGGLVHWGDRIWQRWQTEPSAQSLTKRLGRRRRAVNDHRDTFRAKRGLRGICLALPLRRVDEPRPTGSAVTCHILILGETAHWLMLMEAFNSQGDAKETRGSDPFRVFRGHG